MRIFASRLQLLLFPCVLSAIGCHQDDRNDEGNDASASFDAGTARGDAEIDAASSSHCDQLQAQARAAVDSVYKAALVCTQNSDCSPWSGALGCTPDCGGHVTADAGALAAALDSANQQFCATYRDDECPIPDLPCFDPGFPVPRCQSGLCVLLFTDTPDGSLP